MERHLNYQAATQHLQSEIQAYETRLKGSLDELERCQIEVDLALARYTLNRILAEYQEVPH